MVDKFNSESAAIPDAVVEQAISLYLTQDNAGLSDAAQAWLNQDPLHRLAWQRVGQLDNDFTQVKQQPVIASLLKQPASNERRTLLKSIAVLGFGSLVAGGSWHYYQQRGRYQTYTQIRQVELPFAHVSSNAQSEFYLPDNTNYQLSLTAGDVWLSAEQDTLVDFAQQSFVLEAGSTAWLNLWQQPSLQVQSGKLQLNANEQRFKEGQVYQQQADGQWQATTLAYQPDAWLRNQLIANAMPLSDVVDYIDRYHNAIVSLAAPTKQLPISGVFPLSQLQQTLAAIQSSHQLQLSQIGSLFFRLEK